MTGNRKTGIGANGRGAIPSRFTETGDGLIIESGHKRAEKTHSAEKYAEKERVRPRRKVQMPRIEPAPQINFDLDGSVGLANRMNCRTTSFLCTVEWSWSPVHSRMESYYLQERRKQHWILWIKRYDDNCGRWEKPIAVARCSWQVFGGDYKAAAMILLAAAFKEEIRQYDPELDRFHMITKTGLLSIEELDPVANAIWGDQRQV